MKKILLLLSLFITTLFYAQWEQVGDTFEGTISADYFGSSVAYSGDGTKIAAYAPGVNGGKGVIRVYKVINDVWTQIGGDISTNSHVNRIDNILSLSTDGLTVCLSTPYKYSSRGAINIFRFDGSKWSQLGTEIIGSKGSGQFGANCKVSGDGNTIIASGKVISGSRYRFGFVNVYNYSDLNNRWSEIGSFSNENERDYLGTSIDISQNGDIIAIAIPLLRSEEIDGNQTPVRGVVRILKKTGDVWEKIGNSITGDRDFSNLGGSISLTPSGNSIAISKGLSSTGKIRIYDYNNSSGDWEKVHNDIEQKETNERLGRFVKLSSDGQQLITNFRSIVNGSLRMALRVYNRSSNEWIQQEQDYIVNDLYIIDATLERVGINNNTTKIVLANPNDESRGIVKTYENNSGIFNQINNDIKGVNIGSLLGASVNLSNDGKTLVISTNNDIHKENIIYTNKNGTWVVSGKINGTRSKMSGDGLTILTYIDTADKRVFQAYKNINNIWTKFANTLEFPLAESKGFSFDLSNDGTTFALSQYAFRDIVYNEKVQIYKLENSIWRQIGNDINDNSTKSYNFGRAIALSGDGKTLAFSFVKELDTGTQINALKIFDFEQNNWQEITELSSEDDLFNRVSLDFSNNGNRLLIGSPLISTEIGTDLYDGAIFVYEKNNGTWEKLGNQIVGSLNDSLYGYEVSISGDGNIIASAGRYSENINVYKLVNNIWELIDDSIKPFGETGFPRLDLSENGSVLAFGNGAFVLGKGIAQIFKNDKVLSVSKTKIDGLQIQIQNKQIQVNLEDIEIQVNNIKGQTVPNKNLEGIYIVTFQDGKGNIQVNKVYVE